MKQYTDAIRQALVDCNWTAALMTALAMPDICGGLKNPGKVDSKGKWKPDNTGRAILWFNENMAKYYTSERRPPSNIPLPIPFPGTAADEKEIAAYWDSKAERKAALKAWNLLPSITEVSLNGADCYALRCALMHEGSAQTERQWVADTLQRFQFTVRPNKACIHGNKSGNVLQLNVHVFCSQMADAVDAWAKQVELDPNVQVEMARLLTITYL